MSMMKAVVQDRYGATEVLELRQVERPVPRVDEVLVRVRAASVHADVWHVVAGFPYVLRLMGAGVFRPKNRVPGTDLAGQVVAVGKEVTRFQPGDEVFGEVVGGYQWKNGGAFAEYAAVPAKELALKPRRLTFEQAAAVPTPGLIALRNLRAAGEIGPGTKVLVNGAGGAVGGFAVQIAKASGAEVTAIDCASKLEMLRSIGADHVIDYTLEDFTRGSKRYDIIFDVASNLTFSGCRRVLTPDGTYVLIGHDHYGEAGHRWLGNVPRAIKLLLLSRFSTQLPKFDFSVDNQELLAALIELIEAGKLTPVVDRTFPLGEVPEAIRYLQSGQAKGRIVVVP